MIDQPPDGLTVQTSLQELSAVLWRERVALDRLADLLLEGEPDVAAEPIYRSISALELHRAVMVRDVALELTVDGEPTLRMLARAAPPGWSEVLSAHRRALVDLANEVTRLAKRPFLDLSDTARLESGEFGVTGVRRFGIQRSLRDFLV